MVRLIALRPAWLLKNILRFMVLIMVTHSPLLLRLLLSFSFSPWLLCSWSLYQLDIKNAFFHGDLADMEQPPGFVA